MGLESGTVLSCTVLVKPPSTACHTLGAAVVALLGQGMQWLSVFPPAGLGLQTQFMCTWSFSTQSCKLGLTKHCWFGPQALSTSWAAPAASLSFAATCADQPTGTVVSGCLLVVACCNRLQVSWVRIQSRRPAATETCLVAWSRRDKQDSCRCWGTHAAATHNTGAYRM